MLQQIFEYPFLMRIFNKILDDKTKIILTTLCSSIKNQRHKLIFNKRYKVTKKDKKKWYYNCLTNIIVKRCFKFPENATIVRFYDSFNKPINDLIKFNHNIIDLNFGFSFNKSIQKCIPNSIINLNLGIQFNRPLKNSIPESVRYLTFSYDFNRKIKEDDPLKLPNSITHLIFKSGYSKKFIKLPSSLKFLCASLNFFEVNEDIIPKNITIVYT